MKEGPHQIRKLFWPRYGRVCGGAEDAAQLCDVCTCADCQAETSGATTPSLGQGPPGIGGTVVSFITEVVGKAIGDHHEQASRSTRLLFQHG